MAIKTDDSFRQFLPATQKSEEIQIRPVAQVEGGVPDLRGVQSMAAIAADVGRETEALGKALQAQERERQFNSAVADFGIKSLEAELEASKKPYKESVPYLVEQLEKTRSDLAGQITDTKAKEAFSQHAAQAAVPTISRTTWDSRKREISDNSQQLQIANDKYLIAFGGGFMTAEQTELLITDSYRKAAKNGLISPEMAETLIEGTKDKIDEIGIQNIKNEVREGTTTPDKAIAIINDPRNFINIDPVIRRSAVEKIMAAAEHMRNIEIQKKEHDEDRTYVMTKRVQEANTTAIASRIYDSFAGVTKEPLDRIEMDIVTDLGKRKIDENDAYKLMALLKTAKTGPEKDDPAEYNRLIREINKGKDMSNEVVYSRGLTIESKRTLLNKIEEISNKNLGEKQANSLDRIESFIRVKGIYEVLSPAQETSLADAHNYFDYLVTEAKKTGQVNFKAIEEQVILRYGNPSNITQDQSNVIFINNIRIRPTTDIEELKKIAMQIKQMPEGEEKKAAIYWLRRLEYFAGKANDFNNIEKPKEVRK